jgi:hypothetical protein
MLVSGQLLFRKIGCGKNHTLVRKRCRPKFASSSKRLTDEALRRIEAATASASESAPHAAQPYVH